MSTDIRLVNILNQNPEVNNNGEPSLSNNFPQHSQVPSSRDKWGGAAEFLLASLGNAVGLGNVWRFPFLCFKNGGGAFVIPYIIMVFVVGLPIFIIELSLGQYTSMGPDQVFKNICPIFQGLGYATIIASIIVGTYYNMIIAWTLYYFVESFLGQNWQHCNNSFNTPNCFTTLNTTRFNHTIYNLTNNNNNESISSSEEFFNNYVLAKSDGIDNFGNLQWKLVLALAVAWIIVVGSLFKGIQTSGKVVYFTATFPYVILVILFIRGITLDGAWDGIYYYISPDFTKIKDLEVWKAAAIQVFFSFGIGGGGMLTYASYNRFHNPIVKHALMIGLGDMFTSLFAGFVMFSMIGFMAHILEKPIPDVVQSGTGLAFIVIPDGLSQMPLSIAWSLLFFSMLFFLGIDTQFAMMETLITFMFDQLRRSNPSIKLNKPIIVTLTGIIWFVLGLPLCFRAGIYILNLMDNFAAGFPYLIIGFLEIFITIYVYGISNFLFDLKLMTNWDPRLFLKAHFIVILSTIAPLILIYILFNDVVSLITGNITFSLGKYNFPTWSVWIGWGMAFVPLMAIPLGAFHYLFFSYKKSESFWEHLKSGFKPTKEFRQNSEIHKELMIKNHSFNEIKLDDINLNKSKQHFNTLNDLGLMNPSFNPHDELQLTK